MKVTVPDFILREIDRALIAMDCSAACGKISCCGRYFALYGPDSGKGVFVSFQGKKNNDVPPFGVTLGLSGNFDRLFQCIS